MNLFVNRIQWLALLILACFVSVLLLRSQSGASYPTYVLALVVLASFPSWRDAFALPLVRVVLVLLAWLSLSVFWSETFDLREATSVWIRSLLVFCFVIAFAECQLRGQLQNWMSKAFTVAGAGAVLAAIINFHLTDPADGRLNGLGQLDTHVIAALVYGTILIFVIKAARTTNHLGGRIACTVIGLLIAYAIFMSDSRNAWASVLVGVGTYALAHYTRDWRQFAITTLALAFILLILLATLGANDTTRDILLPRGDSFRFSIWTETWEQIVDNNGLITGMGILTSDDLFIDGMFFGHPHNMYLALTHQGGLVALGLYLGVIGMTFWTFAKRFDSPDAKLGLGILSLALVAHLLDGHELVDKISDTWLLIWMPVSFAVGLSWTPGGKYDD